MAFSGKIQTRAVNAAAQATLVAAGAHPLLARLFAAREVVSPDELGDALAGLLPFDGLKNAREAGVLLADAIESKKKILIVADYDADGATACAVGVRGLSAMGARVDFLVPNRFEDGYGLTPKLAEMAHAMGAEVLMTVDNGIASVAGVARARELGLTVLVTDHHLAGDVLPDCLIVNPNQPDCGFASKALAGVGVVFYVLLALRATLRARNFFSGCLKREEPNLAGLLDLVAFGTVADVVPLDRNNRILVSQGLRRIRAGKMCAGIRALFEVARRDARQAKPFDMGFALGPRVNAAGRLDDMRVGIGCLLADDLPSALEMAGELNALNQSRQEIEQGMLGDVLRDLGEGLPENQVSVCVFRADFHQGVVGIVASRLKERFYRPTIVFAPADDGTLRGSGRSVAGVHLRDVLDCVSKREPDLIVKFGGHAMAAGLSILPEHLTRFQAAFEAAVREWVLPETLSQTFVTDGSLAAADLTLDAARLLDGQVWGQGFAQPSFDDVFTVARQQAMGSEGKHKKAWLQREGRQFEAMFWRCETVLPEKVRLVYRPTVNEFRGQQELQLYVDYWEAA